MSQAQLQTGEQPPKVEIRKGKFGYYLQIPEGWYATTKITDTMKQAVADGTRKNIILNTFAYVNLNVSKFPTKK